MGICIGMFEFEGPGLRLEEILPEPGVFAILQHDQITDEYSFVELGHVESLADWARSVAFKAIRRQVGGEVLLAVYYTDISETGRASVVAAIEQEFAREPRIDLCSNVGEEG